jgi:pimeloyl-ACP methyl ester carboxylesterase
MVEAVCHDVVGDAKMPLHPLSSAEKKEPQRSHDVSKPTPAPKTTRTAPKNNQSTPKKKHPRKLSYIQLAKLGYQELVHAIIRPPRSSYSTDALGPSSFTFCNVPFHRRDFHIYNARGMKIQCSLWSCVDWNLEEDWMMSTSPQQGALSRQESGADSLFTGRVVMDDWDESKERGRMYLQLNEEMASCSSSDTSQEENTHFYKEKDLKSSIRTASLSFSQCTISNGSDNTGDSFYPPQTSYKSSNNKNNRQRYPVIIYLHGNSSSRVEVIPQLGHLLSLGLTVLSFDFSGSGHSDGEYVSLGYHEADDLDAVIRYLRNTKQVSTIALWGRSMGAATALMYASRDPTVSCMILDSPFTDLQRLIEEMVDRGRRQGVNIPNWVLQVVMRLIKNSVRSTAGFSLRQISPISHADKCFVPAMFVAGEHDDFIHKSHSIRIHRVYAGDKNISIVDGDHNSPRPRFLQQSACLFLQSVMRLPAGGELVVPMGMNLLIPPWFNGLRNDVSRHHRSWIPVRPERQRVRQRCQSEVLEYSEEKGLNQKIEKQRGIHSNQDDKFDEAGAVLAAAAPPDMNKRQKDIQSSLFKILGQSEH